MSPKKEIGDPLEQVARTGKIGGSSSVQQSSHPDAKTSNSPSFQQSSSLATQAADNSKVQQSGSPASQVASSLEVQQSSTQETQKSRLPAVQQSKGPERVQRTIYLSPALAKWVKIRAAVEEREISALAEDAFLLYRQAVERGEYDD